MNANKRAELDALQANAAESTGARNGEPDVTPPTLRGADDA